MKLFQYEDLIMDISEGIVQIMHTEKMTLDDINVGMNTNELLDKLAGVTPLSLKMLSDIAFELGYKPKIMFEKRK